MDYIFVSEAAGRWNVSIRQVQRLLRAGRIPGALKRETVWLIPEDSEKPADLRQERPSGSAEPPYLYVSSVPLPKGKPETAIYSVPETQRLVFEADLAYRRGDPEPAKRMWQQMDRHDEMMLSATMLATTAAVCSGDYALYHEIIAFIKEKQAQSKDETNAAMLELPEALAAVCMVLPEMTPEWLKKGDFSRFSEDLSPFLLYLYTLYLRSIGDKRGVLAAAKASLLLCRKRNTFTWIDLDNLVMCAVAEYRLENMEEARRFLLEAMELGLPYGFTAPFACSLGSLGGLLDECLGVRFPQYIEPIFAAWESYFKNWMSFHNRYAKENITTVLNVREYQIAHLIADGATYAETARRMNLSVGRLKNILTEIYGKLCIGGREQLKDSIL